MDSSKDGARRNIGGELEAVSLPEVSDKSSWLDAAEILFRWVESAAIATVDWYLTEKRSKARWSRILRVIAVIFILLGSLAPFVAVGTDKSLYALWGYPCLAVGAGCVALDRVFGFSSSWMRYQSTVASVQRMMIRYQLRWAETISVAGDNVRVEMSTCIKIIDGFATELSRLVDEETQGWVEEFRGHVSHLEQDSVRF
jgi:hypothetical protein